MSKQINNQTTEMEKIDLIRIINNMWNGLKRFWIVMLIVVVMLGGVFGVRAYRSYSPVYSASATFTINSDDSNIYSSSSYLNTRTASQIVNTFPYILNSGLLQKKVAEDLGTKTVPGSITTETLGSTNMITIIVNSSDSQNAYDVLQAVIKHYPDVAEPVIGSVTMNLLDITDVPEEASNPPAYKRDVLKGMAAGVAACIAFLVVYAFTRNTIHEEEDFRKMLNVDCICSIPQIIFKKRGNVKFNKDISIYNKKISQGFLEAVRILRARIEKDAKKNDLKVFMVTSAVPGEGKSTIATNIAMALAMKDSKVVLVDCDLRNPSIRECLNLGESGPGLYEYLTRKADLDDILMWHEEYKMYIVPSGKSLGNSSELLDSLRMKNLLKQLRDIAEYVILDTAPLGILTDTAVLAETADAALLVVKQDYANCSSILESISQLAESKIYISGCILNGVTPGVGGYGYKYYRYYSKYGNYLARSHYAETEKVSLHEK